MRPLLCFARQGAEIMEEQNKTPEKLVNMYDWLQSLVSAVVVLVLIFITGLIRPVDVDGSSMVPTLIDGDKIITTSLYGTLRQGDIVVLTKKSFGETSIVKRVIATEGQTVDIDFNAGTVTVDGTVLEEPYIADLTRTPGNLSYPLTVEKGHIFCMGDNRNHSTDSRFSSIGQIDTRCVLGKVLFRILPIRSFGGVYS